MTQEEIKQNEQAIFARIHRAAGEAMISYNIENDHFYGSAPRQEISGNKARPAPAPSPQG
jgi:hypothetical protein